jgi:hypothetical protein
MTVLNSTHTFTLYIYIYKTYLLQPFQLLRQVDESHIIHVYISIHTNIHLLRSIHIHIYTYVYIYTDMHFKVHIYLLRPALLQKPVDQFPH